MPLPSSNSDARELDSLLQSLIMSLLSVNCEPDCFEQGNSYSTKVTCREMKSLDVDGSYSYRHYEVLSIQGKCMV